MIEADASFVRTRKGQKLSVASCNLDGRAEKMIREEDLLNTTPSRKYRPRRRNNLSLED